MIFIRVIGECFENDVNKIKDLDLIGFYYLLIMSQNKEMIKLNEVMDDFKLELPQFKKYLLTLRELGLITYQSTSNDKQIIIDVMPSAKQEESVVEDTPATKLSNLFGFSEIQINQILDISMVDNKLDLEILKRNVMALLKRGNLAVHPEDIEINTAEDLIRYFQNVYPHELFDEYGVYLSIKDLELIYNLHMQMGVNKEVINTLVDFTLKTTEYGNFNHNFVKRVITDWQKQKITTSANAIERIKEFKDTANGSKTRYIEPEFLESSLEEGDFSIEELVSNAYNWW